LNGLKTDIDPNRDLTIQEKYNLLNVFSAKKVDKDDLEKRMGLPRGDDYFVLGMVTRIVEQKGFEILLPTLEEVLQNPKIQFVILGTGESRFIDGLRQLKEHYPDQVALNIGYDATEPGYIYAGADVFLMPSRYEPCGTGQMIAMRYGTLPVVRQTGGLRDTVEPYNQYTGEGTGFGFCNYDARELLDTVLTAAALYRDDRETWNTLSGHAMEQNFSWKASALRYRELYRGLFA